MGDDVYVVISRAVVLREGEIDGLLSEWLTSRASLGLDVAHDHEGITARDKMAAGYVKS